MSINEDRKSLSHVHLTHVGLSEELTPFIGRWGELDKLRTLLTDPGTRLVTILGAGGMGKTRLAREIAASLQGKFQDGICFIPLAQTGQGDEFLTMIAAKLGIHPLLGDDLRQMILDKLSSKHILLVLDNFEHLVEKALFIHEILVAAGQVKVLVTSREKLNLQGEILYSLHGLQLPPRDNLTKIETFDAIGLFLQRASQAQPGFVMTERDILPVVQICRLVDGMPLGILLAAAWMEHFSPQEIADQIYRDLDFLSHEIRDMPARHHSLRAVFDSSFERLEETQRSVFRKLAVFRGGFALEAAGAVAGADLKALISFVEKSLLQRDRDSGRFDFHELLRQYVGEKLAEARERERVNALHASYYLEFVHQLTPQLKSPGQTAALDAIQADFENINQAWMWALEHRNLKAIELAILSIYAFCDMRSRYHEGKFLFDQARQVFSPQAGEVPHPAWALVLLSWYDMLPYSEKPRIYEEIVLQAQSCLAKARESGDAMGAACSLVLLGAVAADRAKHETAIGYYQDGMRLQPSLDDFYWVIMRIGISQQLIRRYQDSLDSFSACLARAQTLGEQVRIAWALFNIGDTFFLLGKNADAENHLRQALALFEVIGTSVGVMRAKFSLARIALAEGKQAAAKQLADEALEIAGQVHSYTWLEKLTELLKRIGLEPITLEGQRQSTLPEPFSERELEVLALLKSDLDGPEIAQRLFVTLNTVRYHTKNIYRKLQVNNRREAIRRARELGL